MKINNKFSIRETVFLKTDIEQMEGLVTGIRVCPGEIIYIVNFGTYRSEHYDFELSKERDYSKA